jgi:hypothetical protein
MEGSMEFNRFAGLGALAIGLGGCVVSPAPWTSSSSKSGASSSSGGSTPGSTMSPGSVLELEACTEGLSSGAIDDHLAMVFDLEESYHEMVACGSLVGVLAQAIIDVISSLVDAPSGGLPSGVSREGGVYTSAPGGSSNTVMDARFYFGDDYELGGEGDMVQDNVFALRSYLENPRVDVDYTTGELLIRYESRGPLVELLGFGPTPPRPLRIDLDNLGRITREIEKLRIQTEVRVDDVRSHSAVTYVLESSSVSLGQVASGQGFDFDVVSSMATSDAPEQEMDTLVWDIEYTDGGLTGDIEFMVEGGRFDYAGRFEFRDSTWPDTTMTCLD